jgi:2-polyprenyl-3-methyl-5-hydroxy-6-metoxy-1,4-benzoquinol methylase
MLDDHGHTFEYSEEFRARIVALHRGKESWPNYDRYIRDHLGGPGSRLAWFSRELCPEIAYRCGPLTDRNVLDFGCGTGSATVPLAVAARHVCAFDVDQESLDICRQRIDEHGLSSKVSFHCTSDGEGIESILGPFDLILLSGVLEHIPRSRAGLRTRTLRTLAGMLRPEGDLYIHDTPNRLWPIDFHSTQLWWIPWLPAGSRLAHTLAVRRGRHTPAPTISDGPLGLEEVGAWGSTYWEIKKSLRGTGCVCLNLLDGHDRRLWYTREDRRKQAAFERLVHPLAVGLLSAPITAFTPFLTNLVFRKPGSVT